MLEIFPVYITPFEQERLIRVYLPKNYNKENKRYPVLYMHDGQNVFRDNDAIGGKSLELENYLDEIGLEVIVVGIDQNSEDRKNEYCPWVSGEYSKKILGYTSSEGGKGTEYIDFIVNELKPFIDNKYLTLKDRTAMAGISLGGLISTFAACRYPHIFTRVAAVSSAFYRNQEELEKLLKSSDLSSIEDFYLDCGTKEASGEALISKEFVASNNSIYEILREKISNVKFEIINDAEHNYFFFRERFPKILSFLVSAK
ncbi:Predicted hydrolase of the alpha/beta superfamily [Bacillus sp. OV166]|uniref:alpha/beta hydrolase n=1 Tax=Bacillus sp. OV166 TaxID=1882763 RepID=UPI000A2AC832|nr:alpha/beta hydrolase-fold protein [Bacillus sp. OV166]SMQ77506.1 Predicted hydrolase of the alpha/beta superfamily [Bacillus sp. OV166]